MTALTGVLPRAWAKGASAPPMGASERRDGSWRQDGMWRRMRYEYGGSVFGALVSGLVFCVLGRRLSVEVFGLYHVTLNCVVYGVIILNLGIPSIISRYVPEYLVAGRLEAIRTLARRSMGLILVGGVLGGILSWGCRDWLSARLGQPLLAPFLGVLWLWVAVRMVVQLAESLLDALRGQVVKNRVSMVISACQLLVVLLVLRATHAIPWLIASFLLIDVCTAVGYLRAVERYLATLTPVERGVGEPARRRTWSVAALAVKEYASALLAAGGDIRMDLFIVSSVLGSTAAGIFGFALALMNMLWTWSPSLLLRSITRPLFIEAHVTRAAEVTLDRLYQWYTTVSYLLALPLFLSAAVLYEPLARVMFRSDYLAATPVVFLLGVAMVGRAWLDPLRNVFVATERVGPLTVMHLVACTRLLGVYWLVRRWGIVGAGVAFAGYVVLMDVYLSWWAWRSLQVRVPWGALARILVNTLSLGALLRIGAPWVRSIWSLAGLVVVGVAVYGLLVIVNPPFRLSARSWTKRVRELLYRIRSVRVIGEPLIASPS